MKISYCFSSSKGDVPVDDATLDRPFVLEPFREHPFMTLRDYFFAVQRFLLHEEGKPLAALLASLWGQHVKPEEADTILIRYEKYGTLYQIASVDVAVRDQRIKFAVSAAIAAEARNALDQECDLLRRLHSMTGLPYLPLAYWKGTVTVRKEAETETLLMVLSEWFEGYHEWHFSKADDGTERVVIWDMGGGYRFASEVETYEIIKQAARILTLYYDPESGRRIFPWHHGAGDFVARTSGNAVDVRLVTARGYVPVPLSPMDGPPDPLQAFILFFLETTVKMRLDKHEGMGESTWADASVLAAAIDGFFQALKTKEHSALGTGIRADDVRRLLGLLGETGLRALLHEHITDYCEPGSSDHSVALNHLDEHASDLYRAIQRPSA